jgi:Fic family protein
MSNSGAFTWMGLGEIQSKCMHLAGVPLDPSVARHMHRLYLAKGVMATTAIEGNTLSEEEVDRRIQGDLKLPPSKEYLGKEVDNVVAVANEISEKALISEEYNLCLNDIKLYNAKILKGLSVDEGVIPGEIRKHSVTVGRYRGAPPEDCEYLMERLCLWLSGPDFRAKPGYEIVYGVLKAIISHIYLAWIHPFGDGNGRTARMLEVRFLLEGGAPTPAAHLLSNFYNQTRNEYYRKLDEVSRNGGDIMPFIAYAVDGLCGELREQISKVRQYQFDVTWENFVHDQFKDKKSEADHRRRHLVLALSKRSEGIPLAGLRKLSTKVAELYATRAFRTMIRDVNILNEMDLITRDGRLIKANVDIIRAFVPNRRTNHTTPKISDEEEAETLADGIEMNGHLEAA